MSTLVVYPDVDWRVQRWPVDELFATIRGWAWKYFNADETSISVFLWSWNITDYFYNLARCIFTFDTSSLTSGATISATNIAVFWDSKGKNLWETTLDICSSTPANNNALQNSDYWQLWTTSYGNISYWDFTSGSYNTINLDSSWITNISKTWISKFWARLWRDISWTFWWTWVWDTNSLFMFYSRDNWTTNSPKLTITYTTVVWPANLKSINWLASASIKSVNWLAMASIKSFNWVT